MQIWTLGFSSTHTPAYGNYNFKIKTSRIRPKLAKHCAWLKKFCSVNKSPIYLQQNTREICLFYFVLSTNSKGTSSSLHFFISFFHNIFCYHTRTILERIATLSFLPWKACWRLLTLSKPSFNQGLQLVLEITRFTFRTSLLFPIVILLLEVESWIEIYNGIIRIDKSPGNCPALPSQSTNPPKQAIEGYQSNYILSEPNIW